MAEGVGSAPTSVVTDPVFETGAASLYLPAFHKIGCQGWTRTNTERLNRPPCYFDTTWQWVIGAAGRSRTCISSFRRRTPDLFRPRQRTEMVGAAGFSPATSRSQAGVPVPLSEPRASGLSPLLHPGAVSPGV